jgi:hypothetical protein
MGVRGLVLRSLNRQRAAIAWNAYRSSGNVKVPSPTEISRMENVLGNPSLFRDIITGSITGQCTIGSSFSDKFHGALPSRLFDLFSKQRYILWCDRRSLFSSNDGQGIQDLARLHIFLKDGYTMNDQLKAWLHAAEMCRLTLLDRRRLMDADDHSTDGEPLALVRATFQQILKHSPDFMKEMQSTGWNISDVAIMIGSPKTVLTRIASGLDRVHTGDNYGDDKKIR